MEEKQRTFSARVWRGAWDATIQSGRRHYLAGGTGLALWVAGSVVYAAIKGWDAVMEEFWVFASYTVIPVAGFIATLFLWNLVLSPFRVLDNRLAEVARSSRSHSALSTIPSGDPAIKPNYKVWGNREFVTIEEASLLMVDRSPDTRAFNTEAAEYLGLLVDAAGRDDVERKYPTLSPSDMTPIALASLIDYLRRIDVAVDFCDRIQPYMPKY